MIDEEQRRRHTRRSLKLAVFALGLFAVLALIVPLAGPLLNGYSFLRFPLGLFLTTHGSVIGIVVVIYWAAARQDELDRRYGLTSEL
ncbi:MAG: sodium/substrate symporter small subunit [Rhodomicrobiaceae bacterium]